jgi:hypothetical protein
MEKDTRPVKCCFCKKKMYYFGHPEHEAEYEIIIEDNHHQIQPSKYCHSRCLPEELKGKKY